MYYFCLIVNSFTTDTFSKVRFFSKMLSILNIYLFVFESIFEEFMSSKKMSMVDEFTMYNDSVL